MFASKNGFHLSRCAQTQIDGKSPNSLRGTIFFTKRYIFCFKKVNEIDFGEPGAELVTKTPKKPATRMKKMKASQKLRKRGTTITLPPRLSKIEANYRKRIFAFSRESLETTTD